jgi:hypothetical protein
MPIRFRCPHCSRLLGIATRKAGTEIACPQCGVTVGVPRPADNLPEAREMDDLDQLLGLSVGTNGVPASVAPAAPPPRSAVAEKPPPRPAAPAKPKPADSLFETGDVDALLGLPPVWPPADEAPAPAAAKGGPKPVAGMDAYSLDDGAGTWIISPQKAALLVAGVAFLLLIAFGFGFLIASLL